MTATSQVVGRLAPSPTGLLHLGHARSFLLAYWSVRQQGGQLVLRLEDLDQERSAARYVDSTLRDLTWLGLDWDGTPRLQSLGIERIRAAAAALVEDGLAYACTCKRGDLRAAIEAPQAGSTELRYSGRCRDRYSDVRSAKSMSGIEPALRFRVPVGRVDVEDRFVGRCAYDVSSECGDFVILRRDGVPSYQLSVVVDDTFDGVTEVVRGDDLLPSAARQQLLERALGYGTPAWWHVPLVVDATGRRFAKRADDLSLDRLRNAGVDPRSVVGWVARQSGLPEVDRATAAELVPYFDWKRVPKTPVTFTESELTTWLP